MMRYAVEMELYSIALQVAAISMALSKTSTQCGNIFRGKGGGGDVSVQPQSHQQEGLGGKGATERCNHVLSGKGMGGAEGYLAAQLHKGVVDFGVDVASQHHNCPGDQKGTLRGTKKISLYHNV